MMDLLVDAILDYTRLLSQSRTDCVASWTPEFIAQCTDWCVYIETELSVLDKDNQEYVRQRAVDTSNLAIPSLPQLLDALHQFFYGLLQNVFINNNLYLYILKHYRFLTIDQEMLLHDVAQLSRKATTDQVLLDIIKELEQS